MSGKRSCEEQKQYCERKAAQRLLEKDKESLSLKGKSLTKPLHSLKSRVPARAFYSSAERKTPLFRQIDTGGL
jgi:hypothetical protein